MLELELQQYLHLEYPQENARCEWKEFKNLKNSFYGDEKDDVISYVRLSPTWKEDILCLVLRIKHLKLSGQTFQDLHLTDSLQTRSRQLSNS